MTKKNLIKALSRYPDDAIVGAIHMNESFIDGDISTDFYLQSKKKTAKMYVGCGNENSYDYCDVFIVI